jgi:hypothetical protein
MSWRAVSACPGGARRWREDGRRDGLLVPEPTDPVLGRIFEGGSYHFSGGALRYRRGAGGRQPLTPERVREGHLQDREGSFVWELSLTEPPGRPPGLEWRGKAW